MNQAHVEPPPIPPIKEMRDGKSDKDFVKLKLSRYPTSSTLDLYEFRMYLFDNDNPEGVLLFVNNFNKNPVVSGSLEKGKKIQYLRKLVCGEALRHLDLLSADVESTE